jgi:hypothetical protein
VDGDQDLTRLGTPVIEPVPAASAGWPDDRQELFELREALRSRPVVAEAAGTLRERYDLPSSNTAVGLLRTASRRFNVRLLTLAETVVVAARPRGPGPWFPARVRLPAPEVDFCTSGHPVNRSVVLLAALETAMSITVAVHGHLLVVVPGRRGLDLAVQRGFSREFDDAFAHVDQPDPATGALETGEVVVIGDLAAESGWSDDQRQVLHAAGLRAAIIVPLPTGHYGCVGVLTVLHVRRGRTPTIQESADLRAVATQAGAWLDWHRRTVVLDALEDLHLLAGAAGRQ